MPTYEVKINGVTYDVNSDKELTDMQAYQYAKQQADAGQPEPTQDPTPPEPWGSFPEGTVAGVGAHLAPKVIASLSRGVAESPALARVVSGAIGAVAGGTLGGAAGGPLGAVPGVILGAVGGSHHSRSHSATRQRAAELYNITKPIAAKRLMVPDNLMKLPFSQLASKLEQLPSSNPSLVARFANKLATSGPVVNRLIRGASNIAPFAGLAYDLSTMPFTQSGDAPVREDNRQEQLNRIIDEARRIGVIPPKPPAAPAMRISQPAQLPAEHPALSDPNLSDLDKEIIRKLLNR